MSNLFYMLFGGGVWMMSPVWNRGGRYRDFIVATVVVATVAVAGTALGTKVPAPGGGGGGSTTTTVGTTTSGGGGSAASFFVGPTGSDSNSCSVISSPCLSLNAAYQKLNNPSQVIEVACGTYNAAQSVVRNNALATGTYTLFRPPAGSSNTCVNFTNRVDLGSSSNPAAVTPNGPRWLKFQSMSNLAGVWQQTPTTDAGFRTNWSTEDVILDNMKIVKTDIQGSQRVIVQNSDLFGCKANQTNYCLNRVSGMLRDDNVMINATGTQYLNNLIHDASFGGVLGECGIASETCHPDGLAIFSNMGSRMIIRGNKFYNNAVASIALQIQNGANVENVTIENNWIGPSCPGRPGLAVPSGDPPCGNVAMEVRSPIAGLIVRFNSFPWHNDPEGRTGAGWNCVGGSGIDCGTSTSPAWIVGNIVAVAGTGGTCNMNNTQAHYNVFRQFNPNFGNPPSPCNTTSGNYTGANNVFLNDTNGSNFVNNGSEGSGIFDLHLTGTAAPPQNFVPTSQANGCGPGQNTIDIDGQARPINTNCDAGSDEK